MLDHPPKVLADRARQHRAVWMRTYRRRLKAGLIVAPVEVDSTPGRRSGSPGGHGADEWAG
jgi:hypothetical protein